MWLVFGVFVGTVSGLRPGSIFDRIGMSLALIAVSLPIFFTGPLLLLVFEYKLKWLKNVTYAPITQDPLQWLAQHDPALDRAGLPVRSVVRATDPGEHDGDDG